MRFPKFSGEWVRDNIFNVAPLQRGFDLPTQDIEDGEYPVVYSNGILRTHKYYKCEAPGLVTGRSGSLGNFTFIPEGNYWPHNTSLWVTNFHGNDPLFIYYLYQTINISQYATGSGVPTLNRNDVHRHGVSIPLVPEQRKIAEFLSLIDKRIVTQNRIIEDLKAEKKYLLEQLFCLPNEKSPRLRIKGHTSQWQKVRLSDIVNRIVTRNKNNSSSRVLTIAAQYGLIDQQEFFHKQIASSDLSGYYLLNNGDFAYNKSYSGDYPWGAVKRLDNYPDGVLSTLYICFRPNDNVDSDFICYYFESTKWYRGIMEISGEGARNHGLLNMSVEDYFATRLRIPIIEEQRDISKMLNTFSQKIKIEEELLDRLQKQKAFLLTSMFV